MSSLRWTAGAKIVGQLLNWAITIVVIRLLAPADYGLMALANIVIGLLTMVADMGFGAALIHAETFDRRRAAQIFGAALLVNVALCGGLLVAASPFAAFFGERRLAPVISVLAFQFVVGAAGLVPSALLRRAFRYRIISVVEVASAVGGNLTTLVLAWRGYGVWALVFGAVSISVIRTLLLHSVSADRIAPSFALRGAGHLVSFGANVTLARVLWYVYMQTDIFIAGKLLGKEALGFYSVALHLASLPMQRVGSIVNDVAFSAFARIKHDRTAVAANVRLGVRQIALFAFPSMWGLASVAPDLVHIALGELWLPAVIPLQIVALAIPLRMVGTIVSTATMSIGRVDIAVVTTLFGTMLAAVLFYFGARYGIIGLSVAWAVLSPIMVVVNLYRALPNLGVSIVDFFADMSRPVFAALVMAAGVVAMSGLLNGMSAALRLVVDVLSGAIFYLAVTLLLNRRHALESLQLIAPSLLQRSGMQWLRR